MERVAIIDIGTNTFNLLIIDRFKDGYNSVAVMREGVSLGDGGINSNEIHGLAFERGLNTLMRFTKACKAHGVTNVFAFGTSALRNAKNANEFIRVVKSKTDIDIIVLSGVEEASLIFNGIALGYDFIKPSVIMDIGGGSTEFILATQSGVQKVKSFEIGVSRINQMFDFEEVYSQSSIQKVINYLDHQIGNQLDGFESEILVGSSGSFETYYEILNEKPFPENEFVNISIDDILAVIKEVIESSIQDRKKNKFIIPIRVEMLPIAAIKTKWVLEKLKCKSVVISPFSLKEGAIFYNLNF
jgi:exopolyphosphatase/guanosine-5'-triphosphate,3'-diphosphate pyrophosphatase